MNSIPHYFAIGTLLSLTNSITALEIRWQEPIRNRIEIYELAQSEPILIYQAEPSMNATPRPGEDYLSKTYQPLEDGTLQKPLIQVYQDDTVILAKELASPLLDDDIITLSCKQKQGCIPRHTKTTCQLTVSSATSGEKSIEISKKPIKKSSSKKPKKSTNSLEESKTLEQPNNH